MNRTICSKTASIRTVMLAAAALAVLLSACGTSSRGPEGSLHQAMTGVSASGYPAGEPKDTGSPALASSSEQQYSRDQSEEKDKK
jgi:hypothetical protein